MSEQPDVAAATEPKNRFETVTLETPIVRGEMTIAEIALRKPKAGELRGTNLAAIIGTEAAAVLQVIPRISNPPLTAEEAENLEADDFATIAGTIRGFFMTKAERQAVDAMIAEHTLKT